MDIVKCHCIKCPFASIWAVKTRHDAYKAVKHNEVRFPNIKHNFHYNFTPQ